MKRIAFKSEKFKWILISILLLLIAYNSFTLINGEVLAYARIAFIITILILIFTKSSYAKGFLEVSSFLYGVLIGLNLILIVIPLVINLIDPVDGIGNEIYFSLFESLVKMILAFVVYKLSTEQIIVVRTKNN